MKGDTAAAPAAPREKPGLENAPGMRSRRSQTSRICPKFPPGWNRGGCPAPGASRSRILEFLRAPRSPIPAFHPLPVRPRRRLRRFSCSLSGGFSWEWAPEAALPVPLESPGLRFALWNEIRGAVESAGRSLEDHPMGRDASRYPRMLRAGTGRFQGWGIHGKTCARHPHRCQFSGRNLWGKFRNGKKPQIPGTSKCPKAE